MSTFFFVLLGVVVAASLLFGALLLRQSLGDADFWLKVFSGVLAALIFAVGLAALVAGHFSGEAQAEKILALEKGNIEAQRELEAEKLKRLELEKSLTRRELTFVKVGEKSNLDTLKPFGGMNAIVEFLPDFEPRRAASSIVAALERSGWNVVRATPNDQVGGNFWDGVVVETYNPSLLNRTPSEISTLMRDKEGPREAATALVKFLGENNWDARVFPGDPKTSQPSTIKVTVGFRPLPHVPTEAEAEFEREWNKARQSTIPNPSNK
jgi:hypothetical protein